MNKTFGYIGAGTLALATAVGGFMYGNSTESTEVIPNQVYQGFTQRYEGDQPQLVFDERPATQRRVGDGLRISGEPSKLGLEDADIGQRFNVSVRKTRWFGNEVTKVEPSK